MTATVAPQRTPEVGDSAPDFSLKSTSGKQVALSTFRGREHVLLAFFPLAFTSTCTAEVCGFSAAFDAFTGKGVTVLPISVDSAPTLVQYRKMYDLKVELLSDFKRETSRAYGVLREDLFFSERAYFLVDREGIVRWKHVESNLGEHRSNEEILAEIARLG